MVVDGWSKVGRLEVAAVEEPVVPPPYLAVANAYDSQLIW